MTYADIYAETLKLMFANPNGDIPATAAGMAELLRDPNYTDWLLAMPGAVNRCFSDMEAKKVVPWKTAIPDMSAGDRVGSLVRFWISELIPDCDELMRVTRRCAYGSEEVCEPGAEYVLEGDELLLPAGEVYVIRYSPVLPRVGVETDLDGTVPLPERLAAVVPCFVKGDLYRREEPGEAAEARNLYEQAMAEAVPPLRQHRASVEMRFGFI